MPSKLDLFYPPYKLIFNQTKVPKRYILETQFIGTCRFPMPVSGTLSNSPNDSNSPFAFSSVECILCTKSQLGQKIGEDFARTIWDYNDIQENNNSGEFDQEKR